MKYIDFLNAMTFLPVFSLRDILKVFPDFDSRRLVEWQNKNYIQKVRRGFYCFQATPKNQNFRFFTANKIYTPSYISLETAFSYYGLIPEGVFMTTSITSENTAEFHTQLGTFQYRHMKKNLFFGYKILQFGNLPIKIADKEKALLDYFYLNKINSEEEIDALRFNKDLIADLDIKKLQLFMEVINSKTLNHRIELLYNTMESHADF